MNFISLNQVKSLLKNWSYKVFSDKSVKPTEELFIPALIYKIDVGTKLEFLKMLFIILFYQIYILNSLEGKIFLKLFWVWSFKFFAVSQILSYLKSRKNFKMSVLVLMGQ